MTPTLTDAQISRILLFAGLREERWLTDDDVIDIADSVGAFNSGMYDNAADRTVAVECIRVAMGRGLDADRRQALNQRIIELRSGASSFTPSDAGGGASSEALDEHIEDFEAHEETFRNHTHEQGGSPPVQQVEFLRWVGWSDDTTIDADDFMRDAASSTGNVIAVPPYTGPNHPSNQGAYLWAAVDTEDGDPSFIGGGFTNFLTQGIKSGPVAYMGRNYDVWRLVFAQITDIPQGSFSFTIPEPVSGAAALIAAHAALPNAHHTPPSTANFATQAQVISSINTAQMARTEAEAAQTDADAAQATADTATTAAAAAQTTADSALPGRFTFGTTLEMNPLVHNGTIAATAHGLGAVPDGYIAQLECLTAEFGFAVGNVITDQGPDRTLVWYTATEIGVKLRERPWISRRDNNSGSLLTAANWKLTVRPYILTTSGA